MANLNLQLALHGVRSETLSRNAFKSTSLTDYVTTTSSNSVTSQELSHDRTSPQMGSKSVFYQPRLSSDKRPIQPVRPLIRDWNRNSIRTLSMGPSISSYDSHNLVSNVFDNGHCNGLLNNGDNLPSLLDWSEFPSLTSQGHNASLQKFNSGSTKQPYVGMLKVPPSESTEFTMSNEDFPALPGTQATAVSENSSRLASRDSSSVSNDQKLANYTQLTEPNLLSNGNISCISATPYAKNHHPQEDMRQNKKGIQTFVGGKVTNIPSTMVKDQFGMVGLLTFIRAAETIPNLATLALGQDLTTLGLNLNSADNLYTAFDGPWSNSPCKPQDLDYEVPPEYVVNQGIRDKLAQVKLTRCKEDLLFHLFYNYSGDVIQFVAASELYNREWRYHTEEIVWIIPAPGLGVSEKTSTYERGTYYFFDTTTWRKVAKEFYLEYSKLENQPTLPPTGYSYV